MTLGLPPSRRPSPSDDRGAIIPLTALLLTVLMLSVAFAVDLGRLSAERRDKQADADVISLDLVRLADGRTTQAILVSPDFAMTRDRSALANGVDPADLTITYGFFNPATRTFVDAAPTQVPSAVRVRAEGQIKYFFAQVIGEGSGRTNRTAVAALDAVADMALGSRLADMRAGDAERLNFLLKNRLDGADFNISAVGYQGLANSTITYDQLAAGGNFASADQMLETEVTMGQYAQAAANAFNANGETGNAAIATQLANRSIQRDQQFPPFSRTFKIRDILAGQVGGPPQVGLASVNFFDLFVAGAEIANRKSLTRVCTVVPGFNDNFAALPPASPLLSVATDVTNPKSMICTQTVESAQWLFDGRVGDSVSTAQLRVSQTAEATLRVPVPIPLGLLTLGGDINLPISLSAAGARSVVTAIRCESTTGDHRTDSLVTPEPLTLTLGNPATPELVLSAPGGLGLTVNIDKVLTPNADAATPILDQEIDSVRQGPGSTPTLGLTLSPSDIQITVTGPLPLPVPVALVQGLIVNRVNLLLAQADVRGTRFIDAFGIGVSGSDLFLDDVRCKTPLLVD